MSTELNTPENNKKNIDAKSPLPGVGIVGGMAVAGGLAGAAVSGVFDGDAEEIAYAEPIEMEENAPEPVEVKEEPHKVNKPEKPAEERPEPEPDKIEEEPKTDTTDNEDLSYRLDMEEWQRDLPELMPDVVTDGVLDPEKMIVELNDDGTVASMTSLETGTIYEVSYADGQAYITTPQGEMITALPGEAFAQVAPDMPAIESAPAEAVQPVEIAAVEPAVEPAAEITEEMPEPVVEIASLPTETTTPVVDDNEAIVIDTDLPDAAESNMAEVLD